ncbi:hypothetical protein QBC47DRAFT_356500 [Echria macrotheca]|uniref:Uncharacterized protein n=1 Tax=Echria macrotheca TaxID=438768 RepID=A0AAJ0BN90_9PEZI|nr:hypothetical protein QBC47DRAFT_356500 [Echria macrotheca]
MADLSLSATACRGRIVALEGPPDVVSAQLRLLPVSGQILILPSLQHYVSDQNLQQPSSVKQLVYALHKAAQIRHNAAMSFLRDSAADHKRVVFLNGGTVGARFRCVSAIAERETQGDFDRAEAVFDRLVSNGVSGLLSEDNGGRRAVAGQVEPRKQSARVNAASSDVGGSWTAGQDFLGATGSDPLPDDRSETDNRSETMEDRIMRAMRAAEALDKRTASLQPADDIDLPAIWLNSCRTWSKMSLGLASSGPGGRDTLASPTGTSETIEESRRLPCSISSERSVFTSVEDLLAAKMRAATACEGTLDTSIPAASLSWVDQTNNADSPPSHPAVSECSTGDRSTAWTPSPLTTTPSEPVDAPMSMAYDEPEAAPAATEPPRRKRPPMLTLNTHRLRRPEYIVNGVPMDPQQRPVMSEKPTSASVSPLQCQKRLQYPATYVDKATDTDGLENSEPVEEVLPLLENLVIQLLSDATDPAFDRLFQAIRNGTKRFNAGRDPASPAEAGTPVTAVTALTDQSGPFLLQGLHGQMLMQAGYGQPTNGRLPTPPYDLYSPATPKPGPDQRFQTVPVRRQTSVSVQTTLRLMLSSYIPSEVWTQYPAVQREGGGGSSSTPWKPVLWGRKDTQSSSRKPKSTWAAGEKLDLILAVGAERSVKPGYTSGVIRQLEKLGGGGGGNTSRTGRVLFKNLHAQVMQAHTNRRLLDQTQTSPFADPATLARLIVPHLETYLTNHPDVRFLVLEFVVEHLPTVLALRRILGGGEETSPLKIAGIVGPDNPDFCLSSHHSATSETSAAAAYAELRSVGGLVDLNNPHRPREAYIPFNRADFILASTATHDEISSFVGSIRTALMRRSSSSGGGEGRGGIQRKPVPGSVSVSGSGLGSVEELEGGARQRQRQNAFLDTASTVTMTMTGTTVDTPPATPRDNNNNNTSMTTTRYATALQSPVTHTTRSDLSTLEDSEDSEERRLMPLYLKREAQRGDGKKALRWLGLE